MKPDKVRRLLEALHVKVPIAQRRAGWTICECPMGPWSHEGGRSSAEVFGVRDEIGDPRCGCFACGFHGTLGTLLVEMKHKNKGDHRVEVKWGPLFDMVDEAVLAGDLDFDVPDIEEVLLKRGQGLHEFPQWWLDSFPCAWDIGWARSYLQSRGVPLWVASLLDIRADTEQKRVCFPVLDFKGVLVGLHGRAVNPDVEPRYRMYKQAGKVNTIAWLGESWVSMDRPIVVVEGPFDLASVKRVYPNVVSPLNATPSAEKLKRMSDAMEWVTLFDRGAGGDAGRDRITKLIGDDHIITHLQPPKGRKDAGEMTPVELIELLRETVHLSAPFP